MIEIGLPYERRNALFYSMEGMNIQTFSVTHYQEVYLAAHKHGTPFLKPLKNTLHFQAECILMEELGVSHESGGPFFRPLQKERHSHAKHSLLARLCILHESGSPFLRLSKRSAALTPNDYFSHKCVFCMRVEHYV